MTEQTWKFPADEERRPLPPGPWSDEPDKIQWIDPDTDLDCLIVRNHMGSLCGYVGVPPEHSWHGQHYSDCLRPDCEDYCYEHSPEAAIDVHGGLTFSSACSEENPQGICHIPAPGRPAEVWWFGFDCGHYNDITPGMLHYGSDFGTYKDVPYVKQEVTQLAAQLKALS